MPLINDAGLDPTNVTYDMAFDGLKLHAGLTPAAGNKYITLDATFPDGSGGHLPQGALALCTATSPETWVALHAPSGIRLADSSTGIIWLRTANAGSWNAIEAWLDIVADPSDADVSTLLNNLILAAAAISIEIPIYLGATSPGNPWKVQSKITNAMANPMICYGPIHWMGTASNVAVVTVGNGAGNASCYSLLWSQYWVVYGTTNTPDYAKQVTGVAFINVVEGRMRVRAEYFWLGMNCIGNGGLGVQLTTFDIVELAGCLKGVGWTCTAGGFVNENIFYCGHGTQNDATYTADLACVLYCNLAAGGSCNSNKWYGGPIFEMSAVAGFTVIELEGAATGNAVVANEFHGIRIDTVSQPAFITCNGGYNMVGNLFNFGAVGFYPTFAGSNAAAVTACALNTFELPAGDVGAGRFDGAPVISFGRANMTARLNSGSLAVQAPARGKIYVPGGTYANETGSGQAALTADSIQVLSPFAVPGVFVDVRNTPFGFINKVFLQATLRPGVTSGGQFSVTAYEHDGATTTVSANDVQFYGGLSMAVSGSRFVSPADLNPISSYLHIAWSANVGFLFIGITKLTNTADFTRLDVFAVGNSGVVPLYNSMDISALGAALPLIDDDLPYSAGTPCDPQGPAITAVSVSGTTVTVTTAAAHGLSVGDRVFINGAGGVTGLNAVPLVVASVPSSTTFTVTATVSGTYTSGGVASYDFVPRGQTVRATLPTGLTGSAREWVRTQTGTAADSWTAVNF